jgi:hypothetical protein
MLALTTAAVRGARNPQHHNHQHRHHHHSTQAAQKILLVATVSPTATKKAAVWRMPCGNATMAKGTTKTKGKARAKGTA